MRPLAEVDQNFCLGKNLKKDDICFYNVLNEPFRIDGVIAPKGEGEPFLRMPQEVAEQVNQGVAAMNPCTAGGRVRFKTDSSYIAVHVEIKDRPDLVGRFSHMPLTCSAGMDLFEYRDGKEHYVMTFVPPVTMADEYESIIEFPDSRPRELTINMPLYSGVTKMLVGLSNTAEIWPCRNYRHELPVVYYGSSITQGGCASRPGNSYEAMISRRLDCNYINLGFSGWARAEQSICDYIRQIPMSVFVFDYDHNAPTIEHLEKTHMAFYKRFRDAQPDTPIIFATRPHSDAFTAWLSSEAVEARYQIVKKTYDDAIASGDQNVYLIDGRKMVAHIPDSWGVDLSHPNDLGFHAMATAFGDVLEQLL